MTNSQMIALFGGVAMLAATPASAQPAPVAAETLNLVCRGGGVSSRPNPAILFGSGGGSVFGALGRNTAQFEDQASVEILGDAGRARLPIALLPGGKDKWFKLADLKISDDEIAGTAKIGAFNNPKLRIDRRSGRITIKGKTGDFTGECRAYDPATVERKF